jgi:hypothetical protein
MGTSGSGTLAAPDDDEPTIVESGEITPVELPRCTECGNVVFFDDFTEPAAALAFGLFQGKTCLRARDGHWYYCGSLRKTVHFDR